MSSLCLTLGHNASAALVVNGECVIAYENERLTGIKSDSAFPELAILEIGKYYNLQEVRSIYVSHWSTLGTVDEMSGKYWRRDLLKSYCTKATVRPSIDHHDAHVNILRVFTDNKFDWEIVADGFGNFNETFSVYHKGELVHRCFGFEKSLGLLYQYTTAYLGLKMNRDEFKLLGYEAHIKEVCDSDKILEIQKAAKITARRYTNAILSPQIEPKYDLVAGLEALPNIRMKIRDYNNYLLYSKLGYSVKTLSDYDRRVIVSFYLQTVVETVMRDVIRAFNIDRVALTGGLFMNVKLNNSILEVVNEMSVLPICGDLSCGLGVYQHYNRDLKWTDLYLGKRDLSNFPLDKENVYASGIDSGLDILAAALKKGKIVNFVYGDMEFGARALGHTTTFAKPTMANVEYINMLNDRDTSMPMAPMILDEFVNSRHYCFCDNVYKSLEYMVVTLNAVRDPAAGIRGAHHNHPVDGSFSARPQVIGPGHFLYSLLFQFGMLINTSFNVHGQTIPLTTDQILYAIDTHNSRDKDNRVLTVIIIGE